MSQEWLSGSGLIVLAAGLVASCVGDSETRPERAEPATTTGTVQQAVTTPSVCGDATGVAVGQVPMRGVCPTHSGAVSNVGTKRGTVNWSLSPPTSLLFDRNVRTQPAIDTDGTIYVGSDRHRLHAVNPSGTLKWEAAVGGDVESSPAIGKNGLVYFGTDDFRVYSVNRSGTIQRSFLTLGFVRSSPAIGADGTVFVGSDDHNVYALTPDLKRKWSFSTLGFVRSSPAIGANGFVYVGSDDGRIYALDGATGVKRWSFQTLGPVRSSPAVSGGTVYVGSDDNKLYALDGTTGARLWSYQTGGDIHSSPAIPKDGSIVFGSDDHKVYALSDDGSAPRLKWAVSTDNDVESSPVIDSDGVVYIGSDDNKVRALLPTTGAVLWSAATGGNVRSSPAIGANGTVYIGSDDGRIYSIGRFDGSLVLVDHLEATPSDASFAEPPLDVTGGSNPNGLREVVIQFTKPVDPTSFSVPSNVRVNRDPADPATGLTKLDPTTVVSTVSFTDGNTRAHLMLAPNAVISGARYIFSVDTTGLRLPGPPTVEVGTDARSEVRAIRIVVVRRDGTAPAVISLDPPNGATGVSPHATIKMSMSEVIGPSPAGITVLVNGVSRTDNGGLFLRQDLERIPGSEQVRSVFTSAAGRTLLVNTQYTVRLTATTTRDFSGIPLASDVSWTFQTGGVRINSPSPGAPIPGTSVSVSGIVASSISGNVIVSLRDPTGTLLGGPATAARSSSTLLDGSTLVNPWTAVLPLSAPAPENARVEVEIGTVRDAFTTNGLLNPTVSSPHDPGTPACSDTPAEPYCAEPAPPAPDDHTTPLVVTRDNPMFEGKVQLHAGESMNAGDIFALHAHGYSPYSNTTRLMSTMSLGQLIDPHESLYNVGMPPLLPNLETPDVGNDWKVRGTRVSPGHVYEARPGVTRVTDSFNFASDSALTPQRLQLSDNVLLVPVIVIGWFGETVITGDKAVAHSLAVRWRETLDFNQDEPGTEFGESTGSMPGLDQTPPDDIWDQCRIQFRVIEALAFESHKVRRCDPGTADDFGTGTLGGIGPRQSVTDFYNGFDPEKADALRSLTPFIVNVGNLHCGAFKGKWSSYQEITIDSFDSLDGNGNEVTAHEFGHQIGYPRQNRHCDDPPDNCDPRGDLMRNGSQPGFRAISFCDQARAYIREKQLSEKFRTYLDKFGPPFETRWCCDPGDGKPIAMPAWNCGGSQNVRMPDRCATAAPVTPPTSGFDGSIIVPPTPCCLLPDGGEMRLPVSNCPGTIVEGPDHCPIGPQH